MKILLGYVCVYGCISFVYFLASLCDGILDSTLLAQAAVYIHADFLF